MKKLTPGFKYRESTLSHMPRHTTIRRRPETLLVRKGKKRKGWPYFREEAFEVFELA